MAVDRPGELLGETGLVAVLPQEVLGGALQEGGAVLGAPDLSHGRPDEQGGESWSKADPLANAAWLPLVQVASFAIPMAI